MVFLNHVVHVKQNNYRSKSRPRFGRAGVGTTRDRAVVQAGRNRAMESHDGPVDIEEPLEYNGVDEGARVQNESRVHDLPSGLTTLTVVV